MNISKNPLLSFNNKEIIEKSEVCGCYYCCSIFPASEVKVFIDNNITGVCPKCNVDSLIGSASDIEITYDFLIKSQEYWF